MMVKPSPEATKPRAALCGVCYKPATRGLSTITTRDNEVLHFTCAASILSAKAFRVKEPPTVVADPRQLLARQYRAKLDAARERDHPPVISHRIVAAITNAVVAFLAAHQPRAFCHTCLAERLGMSFDDTKVATAALRFSRRFAVEIGGTCSVCTTDRVTIRGSAVADASPEDPLLA